MSALGPRVQCGIDFSDEIDGQILLTRKALHQIPLAMVLGGRRFLSVTALRTNNRFTPVNAAQRSHMSAKSASRRCALAGLLPSHGLSGGNGS